jgi:hypothetical protein
MGALHTTFDFPGEHMKTAIRLTLGAMLISTLTLLGTSSANASSGTVTAPAGTLWASGCITHPYSYSFTLAPEVSEWDLDVTVYAPDGSSSGLDFESGYGPNGSGSGTFTICSYEGAGRYRMEGQVRGYDDMYNTVDSLNLSGSFVLSEPGSHTTFRVSDKTARYNQILRFKATSQYQTRFGWTANDYEYVVLETYRKGGWHRVRGSKRLTNEYGRAKWKYRWNVTRKVRLRATTLGTTEIAGSSSSTLVIR